MQPRLCSRCRGDLVLSHYCSSCTGYQSSSGSHTCRQFWRTKIGAHPLRFTSTTESQNVPAAEPYVHLPSRCWTNRSWEQTSLGMLSGFQHRPSGTRCHRQFSSVMLCLFSNPVIKVFLFNRAITEHWSDLLPAPHYDPMALQKFDYYYYYCALQCLQSAPVTSDLSECVFGSAGGT